MTREERLNYCRVCNHRQNDFQKGIVCKLTGKQADFEGNCPNYIENPELANRERDKQKDRGVGTYAFKDSKNKGADWFAAIGILSIINSIVPQFGFFFIFGLGVTLLLDGVTYDMQNTWWINLPFSLFVSLFFVYTTYLFNKKRYEWVFHVTLAVYLLDLLIWLWLAIASKELSAYADLALHCVIISVLYSVFPLHSKKNRECFKAFELDKWSITYIAWATIIVLCMIVLITPLFYM